MWCKTCRPCIEITAACQPVLPSCSTSKRHPAVTLITACTSTGCAIQRNPTTTTPTIRWYRRITLTGCAAPKDLRRWRRPDAIAAHPPTLERRWNGWHIIGRVRPTTIPSSCTTSNSSSSTPALCGWAFAAEVSTSTRYVSLLLFAVIEFQSSQTSY